MCLHLSLIPILQQQLSLQQPEAFLRRAAV